MLFPHGALLYIIGAQVMMWAVGEKYVDYAFVHLYSRYAWLHQYAAVASAFAALFVMYALCTPRSRVRISDVLRSVEVNDSALWAFILLLWARLFINLLALNWQVAWQSSIYLEMTGASGLRFTNGIIQAIHFSQKLAGILATLTFVYTLSRKKLLQALVILPVAIWHFLFELAAHSRYAAAYLLLGAMVALILKGRPTLAQLSAMILGIVTLISVLGGRNSGAHGFSSIPQFAENFATRADAQALGSLANIFEGAFVSSEIFSGGFYFSKLYAFLSFSPLLSAIDGFESIRRQNEVMLNAYVPSGAINEVLSFGVGYAILYFTTQLTAGFLSARLLAKYPGIVPLLLNGLVLLACYAQFAYSTRTVYRIFLFALIISAFLLWRRRTLARRARRRAARAAWLQRQEQARAITLFQGINGGH